MDELLFNTYSAEEKLKALNMEINAHSKRLGKYVVGVIPPTMVFNYVASVPSDGVVLRQLFPGAGIVTKGAMFIEEYLRGEQLSIFIEAENQMGGIHTSLETRQKLMTIEPRLEIVTGSRLMVKVSPVDLVAGVWTAFWFEAKFKDVAKEEVLAENLLKLMEKSDEGV